MTTIRRNWVYCSTAFLLIGVTLLSACQATTPGTARALEETLWLMESYRAADGEMTSALSGSTATATFSKDGNISGETTCNLYGGTYQASAGNISIALGPMTLMACTSDALNAQEQGFLSALSEAARYKIQADKLSLADEEGNIVLTFNAQLPSELTGTNWQVTAYNNGKGGLVSVLTDTEITALFTSDGKLSGTAGCNNYSAGYEVDGDAIEISPAASTRKFCSEPQGLMEQESAYLNALAGAARFEIVGDEFTLLAADGANLVKYIAK